SYSLPCSTRVSGKVRPPHSCLIMPRSQSIPLGHNSAKCYVELSEPTWIAVQRRARCHFLHVVQPGSKNSPRCPQRPQRRPQVLAAPGRLSSMLDRIVLGTTTPDRKRSQDRCSIVRQLMI